MKSKLAVFDFDFTIRDPDPENDWSYGVSHLFPGGKLPEELMEVRKKEGARGVFKTLVPMVNKMGLTKKELEDCFAYKNGSIIDKMDEVIKVLYEDHDIVMITGNSRAYIDNFLKRYGLFELFEEIFANPETINDQGKWEREEYDQSEWGPPCEPCHHNFCKKTTMELFGSGKKYDEIKYFGDGSNDLHPVMALSKTDTVFPRKDFKLADLISSGENEIKADVRPWRDGSDILEVLQQ